VLAAAALGVACRPAERAGPVSVTDALGRVVSLAGPPRRIVSLAPATTELLFALGAGDRLVGRTRWCDYPAEALAVPSVGDGLNPSIEAVAATRPDLVVMYATSANAPAVEQLSRLGIPAVNVPMDRLADVSASARLLGRLLGDSGGADAIADAFDSALAALGAPPAGGGPRVAMVVWDNPPMVIGAGSFLHELVELAGARNVFGDIATPSPTVSVETIAARNPDAVVVSTGDSAAPAWADRPEWRVVPAVRARRFVHLHGSEFHRPSLRAPQAIARLRALLATSR
jgi:ABC-type Fe3+-hydroxamate transport system substrate-binding protein